jgi:hypothetical protein
MFLLGWLNLVLSWPEIVPVHAIGGCCAILIPVFLVGACNAVVLQSNWVMAMGPTVVAHVAGVPEFVDAPKTTAAAAAAANAAAATTAAVAAIVLLVRK